MRFSYTLLALAASVVADSTVEPRRPSGGRSTLKSRKSIEISHSLETRLNSVDISHQREVVPRGSPCDPNSPGYDTRVCDQFREYLEHNSAEHNDGSHDSSDDEDDEDEDEKRHGGGTIAGAVIGALIAFLFLLAIWYFLRIRPKRKQRLLEQRRKEDELENGYQFSPPGTHPPTPPARSVPGSQNPSEQHIRFQPTPYPGNVPSPSMTGSSMSGLALPTPALTYSPSVTSTTVSPLSPLPPHPLSDKPPAYAAVAALQSSEPQPEASAYQMGQVPVPLEPPMYHLTETPAPVAMDMKGEPLSRY
ncbi:hypothetical protein F5Y11DRAFT_124533 [Daldinia sp. FL1419]|nr:hypothetical protein F5Y11DRAFT_124533 [Daldinia sp. FL1419]